MNPETTNPNRPIDIEPLRWLPIQTQQTTGTTYTRPKPDQLQDPILGPLLRIGGVFIVERQKVVVLSEREIELLKQSARIKIGGQEETIRIVRISDCPNPADEYGGETYIVLLAFDQADPFFIATNRLTQNGGGELENQSNNFVLTGELPGSKPSPPIQSDLTGATVLPSDFRKVEPDDVDFYKGGATGIVAVVDSGVKFNLSNTAGEHLYNYTDRRGNTGPLRLEPGTAGCGIPPETPGIGYCGIDSYFNMADSPMPLTPHLLDILRPLKLPEVKRSAFDDHRIDLTFSDTPPAMNDRYGRHGTYLTAIINQESNAEVSVLPVKSFNCAGFGTLFDVLSSLNYVLAQKEQGLPISVLNASWVGLVDADGKSLLTKKFGQLEKKGIIVVAASGNQGFELQADTLYPASFSGTFTNVITVTSVEPVLGPIMRLAADIVQSLFHNDLVAVLNNSGLGRVLHDLFIRRYKAVGNYSKSFVTLGVYGRRLAGFTSPFRGEQSLSGTSFAAAYVSGQIATYLSSHGITPTSETMTAVKNELLTALTHRDNSLEETIQEGRLLLVNR